ncbi:MAG: hypothetical protein IJ079_05305 [Lachnospiraceae bacterium]|nr:hypothetical protein [Lachnospiraceae bacterium]
MDENYLDRLLQEVEGQDNLINEIDDLPEEPAGGTTVDEDTLEQDLTADASSVRDVAWSDAEIPVDEISELDELDDLADLDMEDLDFEDIDFDEINSDSMMNPNQLEQEMEDLMNLSIDENYFNASEDQDFEEEFKRMKEAKSQETLNAGISQDIESENVPINAAEDDVSLATGSEGRNEPNGFESFDGFDTDSESGTSDVRTESSDTSGSSEGSDPNMDIDALMNEVFGDSIQNYDSEQDASQSSAPDPTVPSGPEPSQTENSDNTASDTASMDDASSGQAGSDDPLAAEMDDLFAMLGIDGDEAMKEATSMPDVSAEAPDFEIPPELQDIPDVNEKPKKKNKFMELLFGNDEEEEEETLTPEQEEALAQEKEAKKQAKLEKKEAKKKEKADKAEKKKQDKDNKSAQIKAKKEARKAEDERILAEDGPEKKLNKPLVIITILFFLAIGIFVIVGTNMFDYSLVITRARNYFERQKYGAAYREIVGVEVKEKDKDLESRIYTVMYVERQSEAYENYVKMNRPDLALDALLSGLDKYDIYYEEAIALDIVSDLDYAKAKILNSLQSTYGLSESDAYMILEENPYEYTRSIQSITGDMDFSEAPQTELQEEVIQE